MKVVVLGGNGQLGQDIVAAFSAAGDEVDSLTHQDVEIQCLDSVKAGLEKRCPDLVINTAAFHHVEKCEADPTLALAVNAVGARNVAQVTASLGARIFHISTDYVFNGRKNVPYTEQDPPLPINVYGNTKLAGEAFVGSANPRHFIVRVSAIYGNHPCRSKGGLNFVELMLKLAKEKEELRVVDDEFISPTPTAQIAEQLVALKASSHYGVYHATSEGSCSWYEFAAAIFEISDIKVRLERARPGEFPAKVARPKYSVLENAVLKELGINVFTDWRQGLEQYLNSRELAKTTPAV